MELRNPYKVLREMLTVLTKKEESVQFYHVCFVFPLYLCNFVTFLQIPIFSCAFYLATYDVHIYFVPTLYL